MERRDSYISLERRSNSEYQHKRFEIFEDGTHGHCCTGVKRGKGLLTLARDLIDGSHEGSNLSSAAMWTNLFRGGQPNVTSDKDLSIRDTLARKYGEYLGTVGRGAFGVVRIYRKTDLKETTSDQLYAVKEFRCGRGSSWERQRKRATSEFCISSSLQHAHIVRVLDLLQDGTDAWYEVMEYCAGGDLHHLILTAQKLEPREADCYFKQLMGGVQYIHDMGVAHRDLKPENILLTMQGCLKITDFGHAECFRQAWEQKDHMISGLCGSMPYIAPEEHTDREFDPKAVDVWAAGIIYMDMRMGRHVWGIAKRGEDHSFDKYLNDRKKEEGYAPIESLQRVCSLLYS